MQQRFPANSISPQHRPPVYPVFATRLEDHHRPVPASFDCRRRWPGVLIEPYLQKCGSCWAYASVGMLSDRVSIALGKRTDLSVDYLFFCNNFSTFLGRPVATKTEFQPSANVETMRSFQCSGDYLVSALYYLFFQGVPDEHCGNHTGVVDTLYCSNDTLGTNIHKGCLSYYSGTKDVCAYTILAGGLFRGKPIRFQKSFVPYDHESLLALQQDMMEHGPVATTMDAYDDLWTFDAKKTIYRHGAGAAFVSGHAVLLVGWGVATDGSPYWIVQNSWGTKWGRGGFFWIRRGVDECHIESNALGAWARVQDTPILSYVVDLFHGYRIDAAAYGRINHLYRQKIRYSGIQPVVRADNVDVFLSLATNLSVGEVVFHQDGYTYDGKAVFPGLRYETTDTGVPRIRDTAQDALLGCGIAALVGAIVLSCVAIAKK